MKADDIVTCTKTYQIGVILHSPIRYSSWGICHVNVQWADGKTSYHPMCYLRMCDESR